MPSLSSSKSSKQQAPSSTTTTTTTSPAQQHSLEVLRVAQQELSSGNQSGRVFYQLSPGAVALSIDRPVLQARVSRLLHEAIDKKDHS